MQIIEYFNFKNKPLTKEERNSIKIQIDEFMTHFDNSTQNNDLNNPILNNNDIPHRFDLRRLCTEIAYTKVSLIVV